MTEQTTPSLDDLIARAREAWSAELPSESVGVVLAGVLVQLEIRKLPPLAWENVVAVCPPRPTSQADRNVGYDQSALPAHYPATSIIVNGEVLAQEKWAELYNLLDAPNRSNVGTVMWGMNVYAGVQELTALGKARSAATSKSRKSRSRQVSPPDA